MGYLSTWGLTLFFGFRFYFHCSSSLCCAMTWMVQAPVR